MFLTKRFYLTAISLILILGLGFIFRSLYYIGWMAIFVLLIGTLFDIWLLYRVKNGIACTRTCANRFSNGDENPVLLHIDNYYAFQIHLQVIDEIPVIFQRRDILFQLALKTGESKIIQYTLRPIQRGEYGFGLVRLFAQTSLGFASRRYSLGTPQNVKVYPSYMMLHQYELMAISNQLTELGIKKIRKIGHHTEFEQIKEYVKGDDFRTINWKATARRNQLMVNIYEDERSQSIYSVIDKGRIMQHSFKGLTLLDYAINASLVISHVAVSKEDNAGVVTFEKNFDSFVPASKQAGQMQNILECLYNQQTSFGESDYSALYVHLNKHISKRSLLIIYTNFDSVVGMERQLAYLRQLARHHVVLVVFFENVELTDYLAQIPKNSEEYFRHVIAEKFRFEKHLIVRKLRQYGIYSLLTAPENLSISLINKYLEMKSRRII